MSKLLTILAILFCQCVHSQEWGFGQLPMLAGLSGTGSTNTPDQWPTNNLYLHWTYKYLGTNHDNFLNGYFGAWRDTVQEWYMTNFPGSNHDPFRDANGIHFWNTNSLGTTNLSTAQLNPLNPSLYIIYSLPVLPAGEAWNMISDSTGNSFSAIVNFGGVHWRTGLFPTVDITPTIVTNDISDILFASTGPGAGTWLNGNQQAPGVPIAPSLTLLSGPGAANREGIIYEIFYYTNQSVDYPFYSNLYYYRTNTYGQP